MKKIHLYVKPMLGLLTLATLLGLVTASAQVAPSQSGTQAVPPDAVSQDNDTTRQELASFDRFLDSHPEIAEQLRRDPSLVKNEDFVRDHRELQDYLQQHPGVREEIGENPDRFMHQERRFDRQEDRRDGDRRDNDRRDNDTTIRELASFDRFMDGHPEIAEQLRKDPSLVNNREFAENHPALQEYLQGHPGVREQISENPDRFMHQEKRFDRFEDRRGEDRRDLDRRDLYGRDNDTTVRELASYDSFADRHPEIAEQLSKDPSLVRNEEFVRNHPALQEYLQQHPGVREEITENPNHFMRQEQRFDRFEDNRNRGVALGNGNGEMASFGEFLGGHSSIAQELSRNPGLANDDDYRKTHPEFQQYLKTHPGVQEQLRQNPQAFMKSAQPIGSSPAAVPKIPTVDPATKAPTVDPMPKAPTVDPMPKQ
jgi:hypothetical protein